MAPELAAKANELIAVLGELGAAEEARRQEADIQELIRRATLASTEFRALLSATASLP